MSQTVAEAAAAYRKRRASKIQRYEHALRDIAFFPIDLKTAKEIAVAALSALNPETNDG